MKVIFSKVLLAALATCLVLPLAENSAFAQAPTGPQGGAPPPAQQQQNPASQKPPTASAPPPQAGVTIAGDVPIVTVDVLATTHHRYILTDIRRRHFRILDHHCRQSVT